MSRKRWLALLAFILLFGFSLIIKSLEVFPDLALATEEWSEEVYYSGGMDRIVLLELEGVIVDEATGSLLSTAAYHHRQFVKQIKHAFQDPTVKAVVLKVNSPGGGIVESDEIYHTIKEMKEEHQKPFVVYMGTTAASGGYYVSAAADKIIAHRNTITGSIGVISSTYNISELAENWGIKEEAVTSGPYKNMLSPFKEMDEGERAIVQEIVDEMFNHFVDVVVEGRSMDREKVLSLADGRIYSGQQAKELGLVDELGFLDDALEEAAQMAGIEDPTVIRYKSSWSAFNTFLAGLMKGTEWGEQGMIHPPTPRLMYLSPW